MTSIARTIQLVVLCWGAFAALQLVNGKCLYCISSEDGNCIANLTAVKDASFCTAWCFTRVYDNGTVERGCMNETTEEESFVKEKCTEPNCRYCDASVKVCNKHTICKNCDSNTDPDCAQTDAAADKYNAMCAEPDTQCVMKVHDTDKHVERRCAVDGDENKDLTQLCLGGACNTGIYPPDRRRCYQCEASSKCANLADNTDIKSLPCQLYDANELCYTHGTSDTSMTRGCYTDVKDKANVVCSDATNTAECATCNTDNCNARTYKRDQKLLCHQCQVSDDSEATTSTTASAATTASPSSTTPGALKAADETANTECTVAKNCQTQLLYTQDDACYSQVLDGAINYGCLYDRNVTLLGTCDASTKCDTCNDANGCNKNGSATTEFTCIRCRSDVHADCRLNAASIGGSACTHTVATTEDEMCYYGTWNGVLIRGCLVDTDPRMQATCNEPTEQCVVCKGANCNTKDVNGATALLLQMPTLLLFMLCGAVISRWSML